MIGHVIVASAQVVDSVSVIQINTVASVNTILEIPVSTVRRNLHTLITHQAIHVIGVVKVVTTNRETHVSATITTIHHVLLVNTHLAIPATGVTLLHQMATIPMLALVIGHVIADTTNQEIVVSAITTITVV